MGTALLQDFSEFFPCVFFFFFPRLQEQNLNSFSCWLVLHFNFYKKTERAAPCSTPICHALQERAIKRNVHVQAARSLL